MADHHSNLTEIELGDRIDLHMFHPRDVKIIVEEFINNALEKGISPVTIIHGKGKSVLKNAVHKQLGKMKEVISFRDVPGNWGATEIELQVSKGDIIDG